jgi:hypothetical protein
MSTDFVNDTFCNILQSEILKKYTQELMKPVTTNIYNYLYPYICIICIYNVLLFVLTLAIFLLLLRKRGVISA